MREGAFTGMVCSFLFLILLITVIYDTGFILKMLKFLRRLFRRKPKMVMIHNVKYRQMDEVIRRR